MRMEKSSSIVLLFIIVIISLQYSAIEGQLFKNCPSNIGHMESINITGCKEKDSYCRLKRGEDVIMNLGFISDKAIDSVKVKIFGEVARVQVPFIISPDEACGNYGFKCPLIVGHTNRFSLTLPIKPIYPAIPVTIQINLMAGDTKDKVVCVRFKARISN